MVRLARVVVPGLAHHVTQRGRLWRRTMVERLSPSESMRRDECTVCDAPHHARIQIAEHLGQADGLETNGVVQLGREG